jgi:hypothetical protein
MDVVCDSCHAIVRSHPRDRELELHEVFGYWCVECRAEHELSCMLATIT